MSIKTQIERLTNNRDSIRNALVTKGVPTAMNHTTDDFASDILAIPSGGIDISDTTATANDVLDNKYFYTADGTKTKGELALTNLAPSEDGQAITNGTTYRANADGYAISDYENVVPTEKGVKFNAGFSKLATEGYAYSKKPSGGGGRKMSSYVTLRERGEFVYPETNPFVEVTSKLTASVQVNTSRQVNIMLNDTIVAGTNIATPPVNATDFCIYAKPLGDYDFLISYTWAVGGWRQSLNARRVSYNPITNTAKIGALVVLDAAESSPNYKYCSVFESITSPYAFTSFYEARNASTDAFSSIWYHLYYGNPANAGNLVSHSTSSGQWGGNFNSPISNIQQFMDERFNPFKHSDKAYSFLLGKQATGDTVNFRMVFDFQERIDGSNMTQSDLVCPIDTYFYDYDPITSRMMGSDGNEYVLIGDKPYIQKI